ncbi:MAG: hypothetical protein K2X78_01260 [Burkholderiaceae bacterium]|nr:hypothetical protein [Burkholderiaceae bacterium]
MHSSQATTKPLTISITALRIDGRKMTISVFQQLPRISPFADPEAERPTVRTDIVPWGYVRHTIKGDGSLWLVAECKGELCRIALINFDVNDYNQSSEKIRNGLRKQILQDYEQLFIAT